LANEILVEVSSEETRVAIIENRELVEYYTEKTYGRRLIGNIYRAKVQSVLPGMQAAFVDIGYSKNAFLYVKDAVVDKPFINSQIDDTDDEVGNPGNHETNSNNRDDIISNSKEYNINQILKQGQEITVQVIKEPTGNKGPRVTTHITLPGKYVVLVPGVDYIGISKKINSDSEKNRLKKIAEKIKPPEMGIIMRTVAEGMDEEDFLNDIRFLHSFGKTYWKEKKEDMSLVVYTLITVCCSGQLEIFFHLV